MPAAVVVGPRQVEVREVPLPEPADGQVRLRIEGCGMCASSLPLFEGRPWFNYPCPAGSPGHEPWGIVDAIGTGVTNINVGERVAALCDRAFAAYAIASADSVVPLPSSLDGQPFPGEAFGCAINVRRRACISAGETVAIVGAGFLGLVLTTLAVRAGATVIAISRRQEARELAQRFGATLAVPFDEVSTAAAIVMERTRGHGADCVLEMTGEQQPLDLATDITRVRGRLVIAGYHQDGPRRVNMQQWNWRGLDVINAHERDPREYVRGMREAVDAVASRHIDAAALCSHRFPLSRTQEAFVAQRHKPSGFVKAVLTME